MDVSQRPGGFCPELQQWPRMAGQAYFALSFLIKLQDGRTIQRHQDHMRGHLSSPESISPNPVNDLDPGQIESRLLSQPDIAPQVLIHTLDAAMPENPPIQKSAAAMSTPPQKICLRSRSTQTTCCDVNPTAAIC